MDFLYGVLGGVAGAAVCFGVGFLIVSTIAVPPGSYFGVGLEPWNLPGTILGAATWGAITYYALRKKRPRA